MINALVSFAAEDGPHISIAPEVVFHIGPIPITNSYLYGIVCALIIGTLMIWSAKRIKISPARGFAQFVEIGTDFVVGLFESSMGSRKKAVKYAPMFVAIFFFVFMNNWLGLMPGVGPGLEVKGVPLFRPFTADLNGTIALAISAIVLVQYCAVKESGAKKHVRHYFAGSLTNPINLFVGVLEMFSELTRIVSLSLRLFLNILIGEILISIFVYLGKIASPILSLPFVTMELFVGLVQAYIFTMLCATYLGIATSHGEHDDEHTSAPEQISSKTLEQAQG